MTRDLVLEQGIVKEVLDGTPRIPSPLPGDTRLPTSVEITSITSEQSSYEFLDESQDRTLLDEGTALALAGVWDSQKYLRERGVKLKNPDVQFRIPKTLEDLEEPKLDSIESDERIIALPVKDYKIKNWIKGIACFGSTIRGVNFRFDRTTSHASRTRRIIGRYANQPLLSHRTPIVLNLTFPFRVPQYATLAFEVFCIQLEPTTSKRVLSKLSEGVPPNSIPLEHWHHLNNLEAYDERVIAQSIAKSWLFDTARDRFTEQQINEWVPYSAFPEILKRATEVARELGPRQTIQAYKLKAWQMNLFLDRTLTKRLRGEE